MPFRWFLNAVRGQRKINTQSKVTIGKEGHDTTPFEAHHNKSFDCSSPHYIKKHQTIIIVVLLIASTANPPLPIPSMQYTTRTLVTVGMVLGLRHSSLCVRQSNLIKERKYWTPQTTSLNEERWSDRREIRRSIHLLLTRGFPKYRRKDHACGRSKRRSAPGASRLTTDTQWFSS